MFGWLYALKTVLKSGIVQSVERKLNVIFLVSRRGDIMAGQKQWKSGTYMNTGKIQRSDLLKFHKFLGKNNGHGVGTVEQQVEAQKIAEAGFFGNPRYE